MEAKLIKNADAYSVKINNEYVAFANEYFVGYATQKFRDNLLGKLSLSNCQAVANGYDLDELAKEKYPYEKTEMFSCFELDCKQEGFIEGAKTILELLGDKKFSEKDIKNAIHKGFFSEALSTTERIVESNKYIQSLQQTEWDVIIKTTCDGMVTGLCMPEVCNCNIIPKLDADGCLILKRI
jgi:hypothetical protein